MTKLQVFKVEWKDSEIAKVNRQLYQLPGSRFSGVKVEIGSVLCDLYKAVCLGEVGEAKKLVSEVKRWGLACSTQEEVKNLFLEYLGREI